jgi:hypothetical protein
VGEVVQSEGCSHRGDELHNLGLTMDACRGELTTSWLAHNVICKMRILVGTPAFVDES